MIVSYKIVKNKKLDDGGFTKDWYCEAEFDCKGKEANSLNIIGISTSKMTIYICKSCLNYLINEIDKSILEDIVKDYRRCCQGVE
jgi:hypothetical protein